MGNSSTPRSENAGRFDRLVAESRARAAVIAAAGELRASVEHLALLVDADCLRAAAATATDIAARCEALKVAQLAAQQELALEEKAASAQAAFSFAQ